MRFGYLALAACVGLAAAAESAEPVKDAVKDAVKDVKDAVKDATDAVKDAVNEPAKKKELEQPHDVDALKIEVLRQIPEKDCDRKVKWGDIVRIWMHGKLTNGFVFDDSWSKDPHAFQLGSAGTILGFQEGCLDMCIDEIRRITIPSKKGHGTKGSGGGLIPPNAALIYTVMLQEIYGHIPSGKSEEYEGTVYDDLDPDQAEELMDAPRYVPKPIVVPPKSASKEATEEKTASEEPAAETPAHSVKDEL